MESAKQICRLCLTAGWGNTSSINDSEINSRLEIIFKFEFDPDHTLPETVCLECSSKVAEFHAFHESVRTNQTLLKVDYHHEEKVFVSTNVGGEVDIPVQEQELLLTTVIKTELTEVVDEPEDDTKCESESSEEDTNEFIGSEDTTLRRTKIKTESKSDDLGEKDLKIKNFLGTIQCNACTETFETLNKLKRHCTKVHGTKGIVTCCDRSFSQKNRLLEHIDTHFDPTLLYCKICDKHYKNKAGLELHNQKKHCGSDQNPFGCDQCPQRFPKEFMLNAHLKRHIKAKCTICSQVLASFQSLKVHMQLKHEKVKPVKPGHVCDVCGKTLRTKQDLIKHTNKHQGIIEERAQCSICCKWLAGKQCLKIHMKHAHGETNERVTCDVCNQTLLNKRVLMSHKRKVHGERKFACSICGKTFLISRYLKEHQAAHEGKRMYSCSLCGHTTNYSTNLHTHVKTKHPEEWASAKARGENLFAIAEVGDSTVI